MDRFTRMGAVALGLMLTMLWMCNDARAFVPPYAKIHPCVVDNLNVTSLLGKWYVIKSQDPTKVNNKLIFYKVNDTLKAKVITRTPKSFAKFELSPNPHLPGQLEQLVQMDSWTAAIPWFVLSLEPSTLTIYHGSLDSPKSEHWSVYSRTRIAKSRLAQDPVLSAAALDKLKCAQLEP